MKGLFIFLMALFSLTLYAAECSQFGKSAVSQGWSKEIRRVCLTDAVTANFFRSPDRRKLIVADLKGFHLKINGTQIEWPEGEQFVTRGSEVAWSPTSTAFFINYGDGSGLDGWTLNVYALSGMRVISHNEINRQIVRRFRADVGCLQQAVDPNVHGLGWSHDGVTIFAFAQTTVNYSCGAQGDFRGVVIRFSEDAIQSFYSEPETKRRFHYRLPYNMR